MIGKLDYYFEIILTYCGEMLTGYSSILELFIVIIAFLIVVYAFYKGIALSIWPGETSKDHIKRKIFEEENGERS